MGSRGERIAGLLALGSVFLQVFYCGGSFCGCAVYRELVLLYDIYLALLCARYMLALTSATPGMPYAAVRALGISTPGRSLSRVIPAVRNVRGVRIEVALHTHVHSQVALRARVPAPQTGCTPHTQASVGTGFFFPDGVGALWLVVAQRPKHRRHSISAKTHLEGVVNYGDHPGSSMSHHLGKLGKREWSRAS
jgi:hypothetical protein